jgi:hypothetical protein
MPPAAIKKYFSSGVFAEVKTGLSRIISTHCA